METEQGRENNISSIKLSIENQDVAENMFFVYCQTPVLDLGLGVDFTFAGDNDNNQNDNCPHLSFVKGTVLGDKEHGVGIRDKG